MPAFAPGLPLALRRVRVEVRARSEFFDLQPVLARYRAARAARR